MRIDRAGWPFVIPAALAALALWLLGYGWSAAVFVAIGAFLLYFFSDPERHTQIQRSEVVSPADGRVVFAGPADVAAAPPGTWQQISIFLSPMDVHINRIPVGGQVTRVEYKPGKFLPAYRPDAAAGNERNEVWIDHDGHAVVCRQVVGILARRIVCRVQAGAQVSTGSRFGLMKFGSRMDVFLPPSATLRVSTGDRVVGGMTVIATLAPTSVEHRDA